MRRKTNAATAPAVTRTCPDTNSALTRGALHTGSDIRLKPHMNGAKAAGPKTMAMRHAFTSQYLRARALEYHCAPGGVSMGARAVPSAREAR
jgi:hypothetical protein